MFTNRSELESLILNNPKKFENFNPDDIFEVLNSLGYTIVGNYTLQPNSITLVKIPKGYTQNLDELNYDIVKDKDGIYWTINDKGEIEKITEEFFNTFNEDDMDEIKQNPDEILDEETKFLAMVYQQIQNQNKGDKDIETI
jgi:hypothetical protein